MANELRRVTVPGGQVAVEVTGSGTPIVFVHGAGGDRHNWDGVIDELAARFTCVAVDRCGYGESSWDGADPPSREDHGAHLRRVVEDLGLEDACAVGTSGGALTVLAALRAAPDLFAGVILIEPPLRITEGTGDGSGGGPAAPPGPAPGGGAPQSEEDLLERGAASIRRLDALAWDGMSPKDRERYIASFPTMFRELSQPPFVATREELGRLTVPAEVVYGSATPEFLAGSSQNLAAALPNASLRVVEGAAHLMYLTHTGEVAGMIGSFAEAANSHMRSGRAGRAGRA